LLLKSIPNIKTMKKRYHTTLRAALGTVMLTSLTIAASMAQTSSPDAQMNDANGTDPEMSGIQALAVHGDAVYAVFADVRDNESTDLFLAKSVDGGLTFGDNLTVFSDPDMLTWWPSMAVSDDGTIHVVWNAIVSDEERGERVDFRGGGEMGAFNIWYTRSTDGGETFSTPLPITDNDASVFASVATYGNHVHIIYIDALNFPCAAYKVVTSDNGGLDFGDAVQVNTGGCEGPFNFEGLVNMTVASDGTLHAVWVDGRRVDGNGDIFTARSTDNGQSFGANVMVNPLESEGVNAQQYYPSIAADGNGNVYVSYSDKRLGNDWEHNRAYIVVSNDGGDSFGDEGFLAGIGDDICKYHRIAATESGQLVAVVLSNAGMPNWGVYHMVSQDGGTTFSAPMNVSDEEDYGGSDLNIILTGDGVTHVVWADEREGEGMNNLYHSKSDFITNSNVLSHENGMSVYPNPTEGMVNIAFGGMLNAATITVTDLQGRRVMTGAVSNTDRFTTDLQLPSGLYTISVVSAEGIMTTKLLIAK